MAKHARYSPSMLSDIEDCPCFTKAEEIEGEENDAAAEGTMLHHACETGDYSRIENEEQMNAVENALAYVNRLVESLPGKPQVRREVRLVLKGITFGTADVLVLDRVNRHVHIMDYKFVRTSVAHAEHNLQTQAYGAAALERFPTYEKVVCHIIAPRIGDYTSAEFDRGLLTSVRDRIKTIIERAADPFKTPSAGSCCTFCGVKARCPALTQSAVATVRGAGLLPLPSVFDIEGLINPEDRAKAMLLAKVLPDWAKEVKQVMTAAVLEYGDEIPGFSLRRRAGSVSVRDQAEVLNQIVHNLGITHEEILQSGIATISLSRLADYMMEHRPVEAFKTKRDYVDALTDAFGDAVSKGAEVIFLQKDRAPTDAELIARLGQQTEQR